MKASDAAVGYGSAATGGTLLGTKVSPNSGTLVNTTAEALAFDITVPNLVSGARYRISASVPVKSSSGDNQLYLRIRATNATSGTLLGEAMTNGPSGNFSTLWTAHIVGIYDAPSDEASRTFGLFLQATAQAQVGTTSAQRVVMDVHKVPTLT